MRGRFRVLLSLYSLAVELVVWGVLVPMTLVRLARGRSAPGELAERLGRTSRPRRARVLVHAVSAGEMNAAEPLVARLAPHAGAVLLSTNTQAGMATAERIAAAHPHVEGCVFAPWDRHAVGRWLVSIGATAVVVMETEIWPNLFTACAAHRIPLFVANGRLRDEEVRHYRLALGFFRHVLACATWIGVQDERARDAFIAIGAAPARIDVTGNLKLDAMTTSRPLPAAVSSALHRTPLLVAGSTHRPEEAWLIECVSALRRLGHGVRLVVAPRDAGRAGEIARLAERHALATRRWSAWRHADAQAAPWDVLVVDEYGWLTAFYEAADLVFIGGTLAPVGGHNVIEAAARGRPVIVGPHVADIRDIVDELAAGGGIVRLPDGSPVAALVDACTTLLGDAARGRQIGVRARGICQRAGGAADRSRDAIAARLATSGHVRLKPDATDCDGLRG